ncbi:glycosyltransferase family 4 protein [Paenibacillus hamazuiensis]|uniref:glycosyltransferase family 4 protein n=1 Tax=Paenibacillus hamazuiensis TaxID=2936508 RepID=UPI00200C84C0|nr:glycosyltransferase family 4 protein [Paenibacillus hamazuiensis]
MNILSTGMGWIDHTPGGLNRYFADYLAAMKHSGHVIQGLMTAHGEHTTAPAYIRDVLPKPVKLSAFARVRAFREKVKMSVERDQPEVFNPHFALYSSLITRSLLPRHVPIVTHFHGPWAQESLVEDRGQELGQKMRYQIKKNVELLAYRRSDHFIVLSRYFKDILADGYGIADERIHIVPGAVDVQRFRPAEDRMAVRRSLRLRDDQKVLFCARRLVNRMGIDRLIRAMAIVVEEADNSVLYVAGDGHLREQLKQLAKELGLSASIHFLGRVSNEELVTWFQAADLSIVPTVALEGFGLVTVEALACGTPVLGTPSGGTKEILERFSSELLFRDSTPEAMAHKIVSVLSGECAIPSREHCREHILQRYTWSKIAETITQIFEQAIEERKGVG